jgi:hypothetical protein
MGEQAYAHDFPPTTHPATTRSLPRTSQHPAARLRESMSTWRCPSRGTRGSRRRGSGPLRHLGGWKWRDRNPNGLVNLVKLGFQLRRTEPWPPFTGADQICTHIASARWGSRSLIALGSTRSGWSSLGCRIAMGANVPQRRMVAHAGAADTWRDRPVRLNGGDQ